MSNFPKEPQSVNIVAGLPRTGTSMMMRMLEAGGLEAIVDNIRCEDEDNPRGYYEFEPVKKTKDDPSWLKGAGGKVVKMVYRLLYDLPAEYDYRVVFMQRKMDEVIKSQNVMLQRHGSDIATNDSMTRKLFESELTKVRNWLDEQVNFKVLYIHYNEMLSDPSVQIAAIDEFFNNTLSTKPMSEVVEPNLYRNRVG